MRILSACALLLVFQLAGEGIALAQAVDINPDPRIVEIELEAMTAAGGHEVVVTPGDYTVASLMVSDAITLQIDHDLSDSLELSLTGTNLLDDAHREYAPPTGNGIRRAVYAELRAWLAANQG